MSAPPPPLAGVRILDLTRLLPGPLATRLLGDLGAEVIKLEDPRGGDPIRHFPPMVDGQGALFRVLNRGKRSLAVDLKTPTGRDLALRLARRCDVVVENFRPGVLERLGVGWDSLRAARADIILCSISGFGQSGPDRLRAGHDIDFCARAGVLGGDTPNLSRVQVADAVGGTWPAVASVLAALLQRERSGSGQWLDVSMVEGALIVSLARLAPALAGLATDDRAEVLDGSRPAYGLYRCADGLWLALGALEPQFWQALCKALDLEHLSGLGLADGEPGARARSELGALLASRPRRDWLERLHGLDCCLEPVLEPAEVLTDAQLLARGAFPAYGTASDLGNPLHLAGLPVGGRAAPRLGQDSASVLRELGLDDEEVRALVTSGAVTLADEEEA